jgi:hypothetical protein
VFATTVCVATRTRQSTSCKESHTVEKAQQHSYESRCGSQSVSGSSSGSSGTVAGSTTRWHNQGLMLRSMLHTNSITCA